MAFFRSRTETHILKPKFFSLIQEGYTLTTFYKDLIAGIIVAILALPLSIAFAVASGARPEDGLYTAIIAGFLAACFGGSRYQVTGPTGAFILLVAATIQQYGYQGMLIATLMAGVILIVMGLTHCGAALKFVPYPVIIGFTSGIAVVIFTTQVKDFFGLVVALPSSFVSKWLLYFSSWPQINPFAVAISLLGLLLMIYWPRLSQKIPAALVSILVTSALVHLLHLPVETIADRFGTIQGHFPSLAFHPMTLDITLQLISPAIAIALLAGIESLLSAVVADGMTGRRHRSDMELIGQGIANIGSSLFGGLPATGAVARTASSIKCGAQTPVAVLIQAVVLLLIVLFLGSTVALIPMASLSVVLIMVAYNMSEWRHFRTLLRSPAGDLVILLLTFFLTILVDLVTAIEVGLIFAAFLFINRIASESHTSDVKEAFIEEETPREASAQAHLHIPDGVEVFEIYGSFFFAAAEKFKNTLTSIHTKPKVLILRMRHLMTIDATGVRALTDIWEKAHREGTQLVLSGVNPHVHRILTKAGFSGRLGPDNICKDIHSALHRAQRWL